MDVVLVRWPGEPDRRRSLAVVGAPRLLLVDDSSDPPEGDDCLEDWIRVPASESDVRARVAGLEARARLHRADTDRPEVDGDGVLRYANQWVALPPVEARLTRPLVERFGTVVGRDILTKVAWPEGAPVRNVLDVHMLRLRRRVAPLGVTITTVRSRGYLLDASASRQEGVRQA